MDAKCLFVMCCVLATALAGGGKYTDKYDNINLDEIKDNDRLMEAYVNCLLGLGNCTPEGKELKENVLDALETDCEKCTPAQEKGTYEMIEHMTKHKKEFWDKLTAKYDPSGKWRKKYEERAKSKGLDIA